MFEITHQPFLGLCFLEENIKEECEDEDEVQSVGGAQTEDKYLQPCDTSVRRRSNRTKK